jgi:hypothetical protein
MEGRARRRLCFKPGELAAVAALLLYGLGALGFVLGGTDFLLWCLLLALLGAPLAWLAVRRRRRRLARLRVERRAARVAAHREVWEQSLRDVA